MTGGIANLNRSVCMVSAKTRNQSKEENMTTPDLLLGPPLPRRPSHITSPFSLMYVHASRVQAF